MLAEHPLEIPDSVGTVELQTQLSLLGAKLLTEALPAFLRGEIVAKAQDESQVTIAKKIQKQEICSTWVTS